MKKIAVIGDGGWGTALALVLNSKGVPVVLWSHLASQAEEMRRRRENTKFLKGVGLPESLQITSEIEDLNSCDLGVFAVPCKYMRSVAEQVSQVNFGTIVSATKGIESGSLKRPSEVLREYFPDSKVGVISGPSIAYEVARGYPTTVVLAIESDAEVLQRVFMTDFFRVYTSSDLKGVEIAGALKNVIAIAAGISDGLGFGTNSKAGILTRGLVEIARLGIGMGADKSTFSGLSGLGDLATTCISSHSRNRWFGEKLASEEDISAILESTDMVVEGYFTSKSAFELSKRMQVSMPITESVYEILYEGKSPLTAVEELMMRSAKVEDYC